MTCSEKKVFHDRKKATAVAKFLKRRFGKSSFHSYLCTECGMYHVTKMPRDQARNLEENKKKKQID